jgi:hypothetical protein
MVIAARFTRCNTKLRAAALHAAKGVRTRRIINYSADARLLHRFW